MGIIYLFFLHFTIHSISVCACIDACACLLSFNFSEVGTTLSPSRTSFVGSSLSLPANLNLSFENYINSSLSLGLFTRRTNRTHSLLCIKNTEGQKTSLRDSKSFPVRGTCFNDNVYFYSFMIVVITRYYFFEKCL